MGCLVLIIVFASGVYLPTWLWILLIIWALDE